MSIIMKSQKIKVEKVKTKQLSYPSFILFLSLWSLYFGLWGNACFVFICNLPALQLALGHHQWENFTQPMWTTALWSIFDS